jgi:hypothetical protein
MQERKSLSRITAGFLLAPIIPCFIFSILLSGIFGQWNGFLFVTIVMIVVSEALSLFVAFPIYLVLRRFRTIGVRDCVLIGIVVTVILNAVTLMFSANPGYSAGDGGGATIVDGHITAHGYVSAVLRTAIQSALGVAIALTFWFIAIRARRAQ